MGPGRDRTRDPWICSQTCICSQTRYLLRYAARIQGQSHFTYDNNNDDKGNVTKPKEVSGKTDPVEVITDMVRRLLKDNSSAGNTQDAGLKKIMNVIPPDSKYHSDNNGKIPPYAGKDNPHDTKSIDGGRKKHRNSADQESESDRSLSPLPPKLPVFSGSPSGSSWQSFIAKFDRIATRKKWSDDKKLYRLFDCLFEKALEYAERAGEKDNYDKLKKRARLKIQH